MLPGTYGAFGAEVDVSDRIVLTVPAGARFRSVATLVLGGIGGRADLPYERMDDLQLAVLSILDSTDGLYLKGPTVLFWRNGAVDQRLTSDAGRMNPRPPSGSGCPVRRS